MGICGLLIYEMSALPRDRKVCQYVCQKTGPAPAKWEIWPPTVSQQRIQTLLRITITCLQDVIWARVGLCVELGSKSTVVKWTVFDTKSNSSCLHYYTLNWNICANLRFSLSAGTISTLTWELYRFTSGNTFKHHKT